MTYILQKNILWNVLCIRVGQCLYIRTQVWRSSVKLTRCIIFNQIAKKYRDPREFHSCFDEFSDIRKLFIIKNFFGVRFRNFLVENKQPMLTSYAKNSGLLREHQIIPWHQYKKSIYLCGWKSRTTFFSLV